jgi:hypothetical protein
VGLQILESLNLKARGLEIVSCPSCGRAQVDVYTLAEQVTAGLEGLGCVLFRRRCVEGVPRGGALGEQQPAQQHRGGRFGFG